MANQHPGIDGSVAVLIVDDARFTCEILRRTLRTNSFFDVRVATGAAEALEQLDERRADIVLADWLMPEMDGLALTRRIRQQDEERNHYTYIMLLTAREGLQSLSEAFDHGIDDFINKSPDHQELIARMGAATRITALQNALIAANQRLQTLNQQLTQRDGVDIATGLGNRHFIENRLLAMVRHLEGRGGTGLCGLVRIADLPAQRARYGIAAMDEVIAAMANRLQHTIRPLDIVGRISEDCFALVMLHHGTDAPHPNVFRRVRNAVNLRAYKTSRGFVTVSAALAIVTFNSPWSAEPTPTALLDQAEAELPGARAANQVVVRRWSGNG